jgi:PAS domain S-box-containing protein
MQTDHPSGTGAGGPRTSANAISPANPPTADDALAILVDQATEYAVFALSPTGVVSTWNRGAQRIKGYTRDEIVGRHFSVFYTDEDKRAKTPEGLLAEAVARGRAESDGWRLRKDGTRFWASVLITALWDDEGALRGFSKLTRDESDRRAHDTLNAQMSRMLEQERIATSLAGTVVHRLFEVGLELNSIMKLAGEPDVRRRVELAADGLDEAIRFLRQAVFDISTARRSGADGEAGAPTEAPDA